MKATAVRIIAITIAAAAAAAPAAARAQTDATASAAPVESPSAVSTRPLAVGDAVRLVSADGHYTGTLKRITPDTLVLVAPYRIYTLQRAGVTEGEREVNSESRGHAMFRGARVGALGGAALGLLGSMVLTKDPAGRAFITVDGVLVGSLLGGGLGVSSRHTQWERVDPAYAARPVELPAPAAVSAGSGGQQQ
jgi:hypothetical protein